MAPQANVPDIKPRRVRDPVYDMYTFEGPAGDTDDVALQLIDTPAFQRLRRIKQLGFGDYVYPGASHSRFAHSLGVFATARRIIRVMQQRSRADDELLDKISVENALLAALLHDVGHGPFSHAFEAAHGGERHEKWTAKIIREKDPMVAGDPSLEAVLDGRANSIAHLLESDAPDSCWGAVISSALDADRLDYVQRDRLMSGTGTGAIDFTWLLEHARLSVVSGSRIFAIDRRALQQAEIFLLARYHLYSQVYFHKICRGFECMFTACLRGMKELVRRERSEAMGLAEDDPLLQFLKEPTVARYLALDDTTVIASLALAARAASGDAGAVPELASRIVNRKKAHSVDLEQWAIDHECDYQKIKRSAIRYARDELGLTIGRDAFFDEPELSVYGKGSRESVPLHKRLWIDAGSGEPVEITTASTVIRRQPKLRRMGRLFFLREDHCRETKAHLVRSADTLRQ